MAVDRHAQTVALIFQLGFIVGFLPGCSWLIPEKPELPYTGVTSKSLSNLKRWAFDGRVAVSDANDSWSASISWRHDVDAELIKLSGPLGQGGAIISLNADAVSIDRGNGRIESSNDPEIFVSQQLGVFVPVRSLRYWVLGQPEPVADTEPAASGFRQSGWTIEYTQMQTVGQESMPRKMAVMNPHIKLKLVIDEWDLDGANTK